MPLHRRTLVAALAALSVLGVAPAVHAQTAKRIPDVIYTKHDGVALTMDVFVPEKPNGIAVLWMVSGGWVSNHTAISPSLAEIFTKRGMTVFQVVHGTQPRFKLPEIVADIHRAVRFVRTNAAKFGVDPDRLAISGGSAGGHLSLMMGAYGTEGDPNAKDPVDRASSRVQAVACFYPPTDFLNYGADGKWAYDEPMLRPFWQAFGVTEKTTRAELEALGKATSPIYGDLSKMPPTFIIHGDADLLVPIQQSRLFLEKVKAAGGTTSLDVRAGKAHGWPGIEKDGALLADWIEKHLGKK